jgi:hypothetical protein
VCHNYTVAEMLLFPLKTACEVMLMGQVSKQNAVTLFICADRYHVEFLKQKCKQYIMDHYDEVRWRADVEQALSVLLISVQTERRC